MRRRWRRERARDGAANCAPTRAACCPSTSQLAVSVLSCLIVEPLPFVQVLGRAVAAVGVHCRRFHVRTLLPHRPVARGLLSLLSCDAGIRALLTIASWLRCSRPSLRATSLCTRICSLKRVSGTKPHGEYHRCVELSGCVDLCRSLRASFERLMQSLCGVLTQSMRAQQKASASSSSSKVLGSHTSAVPTCLFGFAGGRGC